MVYDNLKAVIIRAWNTGAVTSLTCGSQVPGAGLSKPELVIFVSKWRILLGDGGASLTQILKGKEEKAVVLCQFAPSLSTHMTPEGPWV